MVVKGVKAEWGACSRTVLFDIYLRSLSYWNNVVAIGSANGDIITLNAITGSRIAVLSDHTDGVNTDGVNCVTFSSDGRSLVSGADDNTVKLWDMQTGGVVRTFLGHTRPVCSVSISADYTKIVSGSGEAICLWDIQTGECLCTMKQKGTVWHVNFSPIDPQHIISISEGTVWEWDLNGQQIPPTYNGTYIAFSSDYTKFALCNQDVVIVQDCNSRAVENQLHVTDGDVKCCCFSPDGKLIAAAAYLTIYVWDISSPDSHLIGTLVEHNTHAQSLTFSSPSSFISISLDKSVRFWHIGILPTDSVITNPESAPPASSTIMSVGLQMRTGICISSDEEGVVKTWDISTGLCSASFQTPARGYVRRDARLIDGRLIVVWREDKNIYIWDSNKDDPPKMVTTLSSNLVGPRISGDGSKVFCLFKRSIQAWSICRGEPAGEVKFKLEQEFYLDPLQMDGSKIWIRLKDLSTQGWDFGVSSSLPIPLSHGPTESPLLDFIGGAPWQTKEPAWIKNTVTGKKVFELSGRYARPRVIQWDRQYLIAGYWSGEVLILDFHYLYPQ